MNVCDQPRFTSRTPSVFYHTPHHMTPAMRGVENEAARSFLEEAAEQGDAEARATLEERSRSAEEGGGKYSALVRGRGCHSRERGVRL